MSLDEVLALVELSASDVLTLLLRATAAVGGVLGDSGEGGD